MQPTDLKAALLAIPNGLRDPLIAQFEEGLYPLALTLTHLGIPKLSEV